MQCHQCRLCAHKQSIHGAAELSRDSRSPTSSGGSLVVDDAIKIHFSRAEICRASQQTFFLFSSVRPHEWQRQISRRKKYFRKVFAIGRNAVDLNWMPSQACLQPSRSRSVRTTSSVRPERNSVSLLLSRFVVGDKRQNIYEKKKLMAN